MRYSTSIYTSLLITVHTCVLGQLAETWESSETGVFDGTGDVAWIGDTNHFQVTNATWPSGPDLNGSKSLRSGHGSGGSVSTILTDISGVYSSSNRMTWSLFVSGNAATITTSKRVDLVLLSDSTNVSTLASPTGLTGYKLSLWDPLNDGGAGHGPAPLGYSLSLWRVGPDDTAWQLLGAHEFGGSVDIRSGWQICVTRSPAGTWQVAWTNGAAVGQVGAPVIEAEDPGAAASGTWFAGLGLLSTASDLTDFGFDEFHVHQRPASPELGRASRSADAVSLPLHGLTPGRAVSVEECFDLQCSTGWHSIRMFVPETSSTNIVIPLLPGTRSAYYRAKVE